MTRPERHLDGLSDAAERRLEHRFAAFESAWKANARPRIADHLVGASPSERTAILVELVLIDLEFALRRDPAARIEAYLAEFPELAADRELVLNLADREYRLRRDRGEAPSVREYVGRFPDLAARLVFRLDEPDTPGPSDAGPTVDYAGASPGPTARAFVSAAPDPTVPSALPEVGPPRYRHIRFHARGGLGEVYTAEDVELSRRVALKRIRPQFADDPSVLRRFRREAEITARLEHPGIAPIHELVFDRAGRPWYVMRFLKGHTLRSAVERWHKAARPGEGEAARSLAFRALLTRFVATCEIMSYAHGRGVIHRDLTPANVMLGEHGETIVLDWGFATVSGDPDEAIGLSSGPAASPLDASLLKSGRLFGTPAFMSPEQAGGHQSLVGPTSDVYGLGAILYMILAGRPPMVGTDLPSTLKAVQEGDFPRPRAVRAEVPAALEAIALKAMDASPTGRYGDAQDLGRDVERWLADEPVSAYREPSAVRLGRWARRHRRRLLVAAVALVAAIGVGGTQAVRSARLKAEAGRVAARRQAAAEDVAERTFAGVEARLEAGGDDGNTLHDLKDELRDALNRLATDGGGARVYEAGEGIVGRVEARLDDLDLVQQLSKARLLAAGVDLDGRLDVPAKLRAYRRAFEAHGLALDSLSEKQIAAKIAAKRERAFIQAILDDWAFDEDEDLVERRNVLNNIAYAIDPDDKRGREIRRAIFSRKVNDLVEHARRIVRDLSDRAEYPGTGVRPEQLNTLGNALVRLGRHDDAEAFLRACVAVHDDDFWLNLTAALALSHRDVPAATRRANRDRIRGYFGAAELLSKSYAGARVNFGYWLFAIGEVAEAETKFRQALGKDRDLHAALYAHGHILLGQGRHAEAIERLQRAVELHPHHAFSQNALIRAHVQAKSLHAAVRFFDAGLSKGADPAAWHCGIGAALRMNGQTSMAIRHLERALALDGSSALARYNLGLAYLNSGKTDPKRAAEELRRAVERDGDSPIYLVGLGQALTRSGRLAEACRHFDDAIARFSGQVPEAHSWRGHCLARLGRFEEARDAFARGTEDAQSPEPRKADVDRYLELLPRLDDFLAGESAPGDAREAADLARLCGFTGRADAAVRFWALALERNEAWALDQGTGNLEAPAAALAASLGPEGAEGRGAGLRALALAWLRHDLEAYLPAVDDPANGPYVVNWLRDWKVDPDLAPGRDPQALARMAPEERAAWTGFWAGVDRAIAGPAN